MATPDERSYRRGLILGFTMAEVMILVLFALLLVWMVGLRDQRNATGEFKTQMEKLTKENADFQFKSAELLEVKKALASQPNAPHNIDDLFRELTLAKQETARLQEQLRSRDLVSETLGALGYSIRDEQSATQSIKEMKSKLEIANSVLRAAKAHSKNAAAGDDVIAELGSLAQIERELSSKGKDIGSAAAECSNTTDSRNGVRYKVEHVEWSFGECRATARNFKSRYGETGVLGRSDRKTRIYF
jgi:uncharacterized protein (DUF3084 family)